MFAFKCNRPFLVVAKVHGRPPPDGMLDASREGLCVCPVGRTVGPRIPTRYRRVHSLSEIVPPPLPPSPPLTFPFPPCPEEVALGGLMLLEHAMHRPG